MTSLSKVGGYLALLTFVSIFLMMHHKKKFEKGYMNDGENDGVDEALQEKSREEYKHIFTFDNFKMMYE